MKTISICSDCNQNQIWFRNGLKCKCHFPYTIEDIACVEEFNSRWEEAQKELKTWNSTIEQQDENLAFLHEPGTAKFMEQTLEDLHLWDQYSADGLDDVEDNQWTKLGPSIIPIQIQLIHPNAKIPTKATSYSAGYDLYAVEDVELPPCKKEQYLAIDFDETIGVIKKPVKNSSMLIPLGFKMSLPIGYEAQIRPRSGLALKYGITCLNSPGTIDSDYRGEVGVILINHSHQEYTIKKGERIAQMLIAEVPHTEFVQVNDLDSTERGEGGYGHSGK